MTCAATFDRAAASVPPATDLTERATTGARQAQRRTWIVSGAAAVAVAAIAVVGFSLAGSERAVAAAGRRARQPPRRRGDAQSAHGADRGRDVAAGADGRAQAAEGGAPGRPGARAPAGRDLDRLRRLQRAPGDVHASASAASSAPRSAPQRLVGCDNVPHTGVLQAAKRIAADADTLQFFGADGRELARYARAR